MLEFTLVYDALALEMACQWIALASHGQACSGQFQCSYPVLWQVIMSGCVATNARRQTFVECSCLLAC